MNREAPPIFVISLPGSPRRATIEKALQELRGTWTFVDAVDGKSMSDAELANAFDGAAAIRACGRVMTLPEIGCAFSHRNVYARIVDGALERAIVLEDDAALSEAFFDFRFTDIDVEFDVIALHTTEAVTRRRASAVFDGVSLYRAAGKADGAVAYMVSLRGAERLLAAATPVSSVSDWPIYPGDLEFYVAHPHLVSHPPAAESTIENERNAAWGAAGKHAPNVTRYPEWFPASLTVPLFIKYLLMRECYRDVRDYVRREIAPDLKKWMPWRYRRFKPSKQQASEAPPAAARDCARSTA